MNRYFDATQNCVAAKILPGEYYITTRGELITTVLGSCIAVCVYDQVLRIGGMNHFMLPGKAKGDTGKSRAQLFNERLRYGHSAIDTLLADLYRLGSKSHNLVFKVFGGARVFGEIGVVGRQNVEFIRSYLDEQGFEITSQDVGLTYPRKIKFSPSSGKVMVKRLQSLHNDTIQQREEKYQKELMGNPGTFK